MSDSNTLHYLDYAATTPADPRVIAAMTACLGMEGAFGNPASSSHATGRVARNKVEQAREFKRTLESPALKPDDDPHSPFGGHATGAYYLFQRGYDPVATAKSLAMPILVLQGGRDYQVTSKDFDRWKTGLDGQSFATLKWIPEVNHLFVAGEGPPSAEEYAAPNHVDERVIATIAEWIGKTPAR